MILVLAFGGCCFVSGITVGAWGMYQLWLDAQQPEDPPAASPSVTSPASDAQPQPAPTPAPLPVPPPERREEEPRYSRRGEAPRRPDWMALPTRPTPAQVETYRVLATLAPLFSIPVSTAQPIATDDQAMRVLAARDRILARSVPPGLWAWSEVRQALTEIGTTIPLMESRPDLQPSGCLAFYEVVFGRLAFCASGIRRLADVDVESVLVHEATHIALMRMLVGRSQYTPRELAALIGYCADLGEDFYFTTEAVAFLNQTAYLAERRREESSYLYDNDEMVLAVRAVFVRESRVAETYLAQRLVWYMSQPSENPYRYNNGRRCGQLVIVRGPYQGEHLLAMDFASHIVPLAERVPHFRY